MLNGKNRKEDEDDEEDGFEEEFEDDEEIIISNQVKGCKGSTRKKMISKAIMVVELSSLNLDKDNSKKDNFLVKAILLTIYKLKPSAATFEAKKHTLSSKSISTKDLVVFTISVNSSKSISHVVMHNDTSSGHVDYEFALF